MTMPTTKIMSITLVAMETNVIRLGPRYTVFKVENHVNLSQRTFFFIINFQDNSHIIYIVQI